MVVGLIGVGTVGGTLKRWFEEHSKHELRCYDPGKNLNDSLDGVDTVFISVPVDPARTGQDLGVLSQAINLAKQHTSNIFVRSTVLPGTCDKFGVVAMPEFLTQRTAYADMCNLPLLVGKCDEKLLDYLFGDKKRIMVSNTEAELAKFAHNCFGAMKVTYFNIIHTLCERLSVDFETVKESVFLTGFIEKTHTMVPGPDGSFGYGGVCFPDNIDAFRRYLGAQFLSAESEFISSIQSLNSIYREKDKTFEGVFA